MRLYDTATKTYHAFRPGKTVKIYVCGITPYDAAHLGHIFTFMTYDLLQRRLEELGHSVRMVRNITDVDEPIYSRAAELNIDYRQLAADEIDSFHTTLQKLNFRPLYKEPKASEYIDAMARAVKQLLDEGYAYYVGNDLYFDTAKSANFGSFSGLDPKLVIALSAERGGTPELAGLRQPLDFLLWRTITEPEDSAQWSTVLGDGRPGWHIECTIMSSDLLGNHFDLHGGGTDLIMPHHEAEIAQGLALHGCPPARNWLHVSPMLMAGEKMSKSLGNMVFAKDLLANHEPGVIRLALMHYHHRIGGEWQAELLDEARRLLNHVRKTASQTGIDEFASQLQAEVRTALDDDLNTLEVIDSLHRFNHRVAKHKLKSAPQNNMVAEVLSLLGLD